MASIQKRSDGSWRARYRDEAGREHSRHFPRKVDAERWIGQVTASVVIGNYVDPRAGRVTFDAYFDSWSARQVWVRGTLDAMTLAAKSVNFGHLSINAIRRSHIETWIKKMNADGLAPSTIKTRYNNVRTTFRAAKSDKIIGSVPTEGITLPRERRAEAAMRISTPQEVGKLMAAAEVWFRPYIALLAFGGLRQGEAAAVKLDDIDFLRRQLKVTRQVQRIPGGSVGARAEIRAPKFNSERIVFLPEGLLTMLSEHVRTVGVRPEGVAVRRSGRPATEDHRPPLVAQGGRRCRLVGHQDARPQAFLRQWADRQWVRRGDGAAGDGALQRDDDAGHLLALVADRRGAHQQSV